MNEKKARQIIGEENITENNILVFAESKYSDWSGRKRIVLDGSYYIIELEAIIWWMKNK